MCFCATSRPVSLSVEVSRWVIGWSVICFSYLLRYSGVFVNNYSNFVLWVNQEDQLRLVSVSNGKDLKYALLRLQKAVARIEEALKVFLALCG